jgi:poly(3-hydroxybutyrate) depolymerase
MKKIAPHINRRGLCRTAVVLVTAALATVAAGPASGVSRGPVAVRSPRVLTITYKAHNGVPREATVLLPAGYRPGANPPLPLVISPHGRGGSGLSNSKFWGRLPTVGGFAVVNPDGMGRKLKNFSYGYSGQIDDLARMPSIVTEALPWVRIDRSRVYALGSSMGGQETLLLVARHPEVLAGAAAMDSVTDLALRYEQVLDLPTNPEFVERWGASESECLRSAMRREVGGAPATSPRAYAARSPLRLATAIAKSAVPLQIWWSKADKIVTDQRTQSGALYRELLRRGTRAPVEAFVGRWAHSREMRSTDLLPVALRGFGLLPGGGHGPAGVEHLV